MNLILSVVRTMFEDLKRTGALLKPSDSAGKLVALLRLVVLVWLTTHVFKIMISGGAISNPATMSTIMTKRSVGRILRSIGQISLTSCSQVKEAGEGGGGSATPTPPPPASSTTPLPPPAQ